MVYNFFMFAFLPLLKLINFLETTLKVLQNAINKKTFYQLSVKLYGAEIARVDFLTLLLLLSFVK